MPVLPQAIDISRTAASPTSSVAQIRTGQVEEAVGNLGQSVTRAANITNDVQHRLAKLHAQDALVELKRSQNELTYGKDGYAKLQNGAAAEPGVYKKYEDLHRNAAAVNASKLNPLAKQYYDREAKEMGDNFQAGFLRHAMTEEINHRGTVYKAQVEVSAQTAALNYNNPEVLEREKTSRNRVLAQHFEDNGITDPKLREAMALQAHGAAHEAVVREYLNRDQVQEANAYLKANEQEMPTERKQAVENAMKHELAADDGRTVATKMYNMRIEGKSEVEIQQEKMRLTQGKGSTVSNFADNEYRDLVKAQQTDERRAMGSILLDSMGGGAGTGLNDPRLKELGIDNPELAARVRKTLQVQADKSTGTGGSKKGASDMAVYAQIADHINSGAEVTSEDIAGAAAGRLTPADTKALINMVGKRDTAAGKFKLSPNLLNASIPDSASKNVQKRNEYKGHVEQKLQEWKEVNPNKVPTPDEQKAIIRSASEEYIVVIDWWIDSTKEAYKLEGTEAKLYPKRYKTQLSDYTEDERVSAYAAYQASIRNRKKGDVPLSEAEFLVDYETTRKEAREKGQKRTKQISDIPTEFDKLIR